MSTIDVGTRIPRDSYQYLRKIFPGESDYSLAKTAIIAGVELFKTIDRVRSSSGLDFDRDVKRFLGVVEAFLATPDLAAVMLTMNDRSKLTNAVKLAQLMTNVSRRVVDEDFCSVSEASIILGVSKKTVRRWIQKKVLRAVKPGKSYLIPRAEIETLRKLNHHNRPSTR